MLLVRISSRLSSTKLTACVEKALYRDADVTYDSRSYGLLYCIAPRLKTALVPVERILLSDPETLPFEENSQDCIMSSMGMHWVNDLPGESTLRDIKPFPDLELVRRTDPGSADFTA